MTFGCCPPSCSIAKWVLSLLLTYLLEEFSVSPESTGFDCMNVVRMSWGITRSFYLFYLLEAASESPPSTRLCHLCLLCHASWFLSPLSWISQAFPLPLSVFRMKSLHPCFYSLRYRLTQRQPVFCHLYPEVHCSASCHPFPLSITTGILLVYHVPWLMIKCSERWHSLPKVTEL